MDQSAPVATAETDVRKHTGSKYIRRIQSTESAEEFVLGDVYSVLNAFNITCPGVAHGLKKLLCAGIRKKATLIQDLKESIDAIVRSPQLVYNRLEDIPVCLCVIIYGAVDPSPYNKTITNSDLVLDAFNVTNVHIRKAISLLLNNCSGLYSAKHADEYKGLIDDAIAQIQKAIEELEKAEENKPCLSTPCWHRDLIHKIDDFVAGRMVEKNIDPQSPAGQEIAAALTLIKELDKLIRTTIMEKNECNTVYTTMRTKHNDELQARAKVEAELVLAMGHLRSTWYKLEHYVRMFKGVCCADGTEITMHANAHKDLAEACEFINKFYGYGKYRVEVAKENETAE